MRNRIFLVIAVVLAFVAGLSFNFFAHGPMQSNNATTSAATLKAALDDKTEPTAKNFRGGNSLIDTCFVSDEYASPEATVAICEQAVRYATLPSPLQSSLYVHLADAYHFSFQPQLAINAASEAINIEPKNVKAWIARANARMGQEDRSGAISDAQKALELEPENIDALTSLSWAASETQLGYDVTGQILFKDLKNPIGLLNMSAHEINNGRADCALLFLDMFLALDPKKITAARIYLPRGPYELSPRDYGLYRRAMVRQELGEPAAMDDYDELVRNNPHNPYPLLKRAEALLSMKNDLRHALADVDAALELNPENADALEIKQQLGSLIGISL